MSGRFFSIKKECGGIACSILKIKFKIKKPSVFEKALYEKFTNHTVKEKTIILIEANNCHRETLPGYYKLLKKLGYNVEVLTRGRSTDVFCKDDDCLIWNLSGKTFDYLFKNNFDFFKKYERIIYNSRILYFKKENDIKDVYKNLPQGKKENIYVQHHIDKLGNYPDDKQIVLANPLKEEKLNKFAVNPNHFREHVITDKNEKVTNFITVGHLSSKRRNIKLILDAVEKLINENYKNFTITIIGSGEHHKLNKKLKPYFNILGMVNFQTMYEELKKADYFLPLLDPDIKAQQRYMKSGTSGSFQLIYGFIKPCLLHKTFAEIYDFSDKCGFIYESNEKLIQSMKDAINLDGDNYKTMQANLEAKVEKINETSIENLKNLLEEISDTEEINKETQCTSCQ